MVEVQGRTVVPLTAPLPRPDRTHRGPRLQTPSKDQARGKD
jgi:hypothetical protein